MKAHTLLLCLTSIFLFAPGMVNAQKKNLPDVIEFAGAVDGGGTDNVYPSIYTGPVQFSHKKHFSFPGVGCIDCHHDKNAATIARSESPEALRCRNCHLKEGLIRGPMAENGASHDDLVAHRANVLHMLCIGCHQKHNNKMRVVRVPESCITCHAKHPQGWVIR